MTVVEACLKLVEELPGSRGVAHRAIARRRGTDNAKPRLPGAG